MKSNATIDKQRGQELWNLLDKARGEFPMEFLSVVSYLQEHGQKLSIAELMYLQQRVGDQGGTFVVPPSVAQFFSLLIESSRCDRVLNPAGGFGLLGAWVADGAPTLSIDVVSRFPEAANVIAPLDLNNLVFHAGAINETQDQLADTYDAIVASGPIGLRRESRNFETDAGKVELHDDPTNLLIADVAKRLSPDGFMATVVSHQFSFKTGPRSVRANLKRFGLHLSALLALRPGIFVGTPLSFNLAIIDRKPHDTLFVAEVPEDLAGQTALVERLRNRKQGPTASQGSLVNPGSFYGFAAFEAQERYDKLAKNKGLIAVDFSQAVPTLRRTRQGSNFEPLEEHPHAVYLPEMAKTPATTLQEDLPERLRSYFQLLVDPDVVLPEYLAELLNSELGESLRQSVMTGTTIPRINRNLLTESVLYLVPVSDQGLAIEARSEIHRLRSELSELESQIWERPRQVEHVIEALGKVNREERFDEWIETLPFPLASILRSYHALDQTDKDKYERLLHFFEAFTEFCAAIHLSAFSASDVHWQPELDELQRIMQKQHFSLERATFGLWCAIVGRLAGKLRSMLNGKDDEQAVAHSLYATASSIPLEMLSSKPLIGLLQRVNGFRNRWTGHGGAVTHLEAAERHRDLKKELEELRAIVGIKFLQYQLIEPRTAEILEGPLFRCRVRRVMGSNPQLEHQTVTVTTPAKKGALYLHNPGHNKVLELIPIVQVRDTPQPASYFYNRCERAELHLVSYHFTERSEVSSPSAALSTLFNDFMLRDIPPEDTQA